MWWMSIHLFSAPCHAVSGPRIEAVRSRLSQSRSSNPSAGIIFEIY
jgi:hypothetical protein